MATINYAAREINVKIVYYGPALSGKTTNLQIIHKKAPQEAKSDMVSLATESDRTLFFDFLPIDLGKIKGFTTKIQLYTVPGQVYYNATRKLVLRGVDGIVFVADSAADKLAENIESLDNMEENLAEYGYSLKSIPVVLQFNKRDCENPLSEEELEKKLNRYNSKCVSAVAMSGKGVFDTLKIISKEVIDVLNKKYESANADISGKPAALETPKPVEDPVIAANTVKLPTQMAKNGGFADIFANAPKEIEKPQEEIKPAEDDLFDDIPAQTAYEEIVLEDAADNNYQQHIAEKEKKAEEIIKGLSSEINIDDLFDAPAEKTPEAKPAPVAATVEIEDDFAVISTDAQSMPTKEIPATKPENSILEDAFDDTPAPVAAKPVEQNPIRAAFENKYSDGWIPPEQVLFSSVDTDSPKTAHIIATKKKPINPKYKKSFLDNLFKKQPQE